MEAGRKMDEKAGKTGGPLLNLSRLDPKVAEVAKPFFEEVILAGGTRVISIAVVASAVTPDYRHGKSDINSVIVVDAIDTPLLDSIAALGKRFGRKGLAVPLVVTPGYIARSLDSFPLEFLEFQSAHAVVYGDDLFSGLVFDNADVRLAAERGLKGLTVNLQRGYLSCVGDAKRLRDLLVTSLNAAVPLLRGILFYRGISAPATKAECVRAATRALGLSAEPFEKILAMRDGDTPREDELRSIFKGLYDAIDAQSEAIDRG
jgi:hypothetical protein